MNPMSKTNSWYLYSQFLVIILKLSLLKLWYTPMDLKIICKILKKYIWIGFLKYSDVKKIFTNNFSNKLELQAYVMAGSILNILHLYQVKKDLKNK